MLQLRQIAACERLDGNQATQADVPGLDNVAVGALRDSLEYVILLDQALNTDQPRCGFLAQSLVDDELSLQRSPPLRESSVVVVEGTKSSSIPVGVKLGVNQIERGFYVLCQPRICGEIFFGETV